MPRITAPVPPPPPAPRATVRARRRTTVRPAAAAARAAAAPAPTRAMATPTRTPPSGAADALTGAAASAGALLRLRPVSELVAALGRSDADLDRWLAAGLPLRTYRTPDGERFADPAELLAALAEPRPTTAVGATAGKASTAVTA